MAMQNVNEVEDPMAIRKLNEWEDPFAIPNVNGFENILANSVSSSFIMPKQLQEGLFSIESEKAIKLKKLKELHLIKEQKLFLKFKVEELRLESSH